MVESYEVHLPNEKKFKYSNPHVNNAMSISMSNLQAISHITEDICECCSTQTGTLLKTSQDFEGRLEHSYILTSW